MPVQMIKNWTLTWDGKEIPASVPGDITIDFYRAGLIADPYIAENYKESEWIQRADFTYKAVIDVDEKTYAEEAVDLVFKGIDLFAEIYLNGHLLGRTINMFLEYKYDVKQYLKLGKNELLVKMESTKNRMEKYDSTGYYACFNDYRIFVRKAQCHFGWDWAPKICAYGIWQDVYLDAHNKFQINDIKVVADMYGNLSFHSEINYNLKARLGPNDVVVVPAEKDLGDVIRYTVGKKPGKDPKDVYVKEMKITGQKAFCNFVYNDPELWWPTGYGKQPLYYYKAELIRDGKVIHVKEGRFAFRSCGLEETPVGDELMGFKFTVNGVRIYIKGSAWAPIECFTGVVKDEKYRKIIRMAKDKNFNCLRVWGGGIYEKDIFYDTCDEEGILVWQDIMLACADIPEESKEFVDNFLNEIEYQVKRLRNHPSLIYWCGGNEKTGCYGLCVSHGDFLVNNTLRGFILNLDQTRPYRNQSPYSLTDIGNETSSGESHYGSAETTISLGLEHYRECVASKKVPFVSECAVMGPTSVECIKRMFPEEHWWPMDDMWDDRLMDNPYAGVHFTFANRELKFATDLYGAPTSLEDFVPKGMIYHAEALKCEADYARACKGINFGFCNWMYSDIWPSSTWAIIDYSLEPKEAYYQLGRSYAHQYVNFYQNHDGKIEIFAANDSNELFSTLAKVSLKDFSGKVYETKVIEIKNLGNESSYTELLGIDVPNDKYLSVEYTVNGEVRKGLYSPDFYAHKRFESKYTYKVVSSEPHKAVVEFKAETFVKSLFIHFKDNYRYVYSDNYLNIEPGDSVKVTITSDEVIDLAKMETQAYR